jgi:selenocysteine-specific elongation factor
VSTRALVIGTAGHVDHGKTALVRALTGIETDRLPEERERGLTIDLGFAPLDLGPKLEVGVVDVPGHEDFLRNMLAGASGVDLLLLVVAADEGPMPQTREHLAIARLLGVRRGVVALTKTDRVDADWLGVAREMTVEELAAAGVEPVWPVIPVSALEGTGLDALRDALRAAAEPTARDGRDLFRLPVDRSFTVRGVGTVVTGTVWSGRVRRGEEVRLLPSARTARVRTLQVHGRDRTEAGPGLRCALSLVGVSREEVARGETAVSGPGWRASRRVGARIVVLPGAPGPIEHATTLRLHLGTREIRARVLLEDRDSVAAGTEAWGVLDCSTPIVARARDRFVLRSLSPAATVGGGVVAEVDPPRRWRDRLVGWAALVGEDGGAAAVATVRMAGGLGLDPAELPFRTGWWWDPGGEPPVSTASVGGRLFAEPWPERAREAAVAILSASHHRRPRVAWESLETLRAALARTFAPELMDAALAGLVAEGRMERRGAEMRLAGHEARLDEEEALARSRLLTLLRDGGLAPPPPESLAAEACGGDRPLLNDLLRILVEQGAVIALGPDLFLEAACERELRGLAIGVLAAGEPAAPSAFAAATGLSRRQLIPLLEHLDRTGWTRRTGDGRVRGPAALWPGGSAPPGPQSR